MGVAGIRRVIPIDEYAGGNAFFSSAGPVEGGWVDVIVHIFGAGWGGGKRTVARGNLAVVCAGGVAGRAVSYPGSNRPR